MLGGSPINVIDGRCSIECRLNRRNFRELRSDRDDRTVFNFPWAEPADSLNRFPPRESDSLAESATIGRPVDSEIRRDFSEYHSVSSPSRLIFNYLWIKEKSWLENVDFASVSRDFHQSFASFLPFLSFLFAPSILTRIRQKINFTINDWIFQIFSQSRLVIYISTLVFWS